MATFFQGGSPPSSGMTPTPPRRVDPGAPGLPQPPHQDAIDLGHVHRGTTPIVRRRASTGMTPRPQGGNGPTPY